MSSYRNPDNRYPRDRSPYRENRDRRPSGFGRGYPPRENDNNNIRPNNDPNAFQPRDAPRGPKSLVDTSRGPPSAPTSGVPSGPRETPRDIPRDIIRDVPRDITRDGPHEGRGRGFAGRGEAPSLRDAPPLGNGNHTGNHWRPGLDRDRGRDFDRRDRRPSPRRSPIRDSRDSRDFVPRDLDINRARRNSRDGPPSAGSTYSDPPLGTGSTYRGSGRGRGIGRDFSGDMRGRGGRNFHVDDRDRHDARDRMPDRAYRQRSRSRDSIRRERDPRDLRDDRDFDRRDRDDRGFRPGYDSYVGPASSIKPGMRTLDTHRGSGAPDARHIPATPTGPTTPHLSHHPSAGDRLGPPTDTYSRRSSIVVEPLSAKDARRESEQNSLLLIRAEASRERYAPRASSPPAAVPAFGFSNVWRNPALDVKPTVAAHVPKPVPTTPSVPVVPAPMSVAPTAPVIPTAPKVGVPSGPPTVQPSVSKAPPTGPKADRVPDRPQGDSQSQDNRPSTIERPRIDAPLRPPPISTVPPKIQAIENVERKPAPPVPASAPAPAPAPAPASASASASAPAPVPTQALVLAPPPLPPSPAHSVLASVPAPVVAPTAPSVPTQPQPLPQPQPQAPPQPPVQPQSYATSPPSGPAVRIRAPPTGPQASLRQNVSPSFARPQLPAPYAQIDVSPVTVPSSGFPRNSILTNTSPKSMPAYIPTGPKADRTNQMGPRPLMYPPNDRAGFAASSNFPPQRMPMGGFPKSHQWVNPGLNRPSTIPTKREYPVEDRERSFGSAPKAPKLEGGSAAIEAQRPEQHGPQSPVVTRTLSETDRPKERAASGPPKVPSPKPANIEIRRMSDVSMLDVSPRTEKIPVSVTSSANAMMDDSDDDLDLDEDDFAESEAKYEREKAHLESKFVELNAPHLRATTPLQEIMLLASLTIDHLPRQETKPADEEMTSPPSVQLQPESVTAELLTPKAEEPEDIVMEEKEEKPLAPATQALRLRREASPEQEPVQDYSSLPYLGSGPPTPLSDLEQDRPSLSESVMIAIRSNLRKEIEPAMDPDDVLRRYANVYRQWRMHIRDFDDVQDPEDLERQPSIEPGLKVMTPDPQSAAMAAMMDGPPTTGRRNHSSRWATELDFEQALKESLKTAEEERNGKKKEEPRKSMSDPEREATVPVELTAYDAQRRRFIDTNFQREPGQGIFVYHYEPPEDDFTEAEHKIMVSHYKDQYAKKWGKLAEMLWNEARTERTYKDCINHYYATKWGREYKGKVRGRRGGARKRGGGAGRGRGNVTNVDRSEVTNEDGSTPLALTETGRPRRSAAPTFGAETEFDTAMSTPTPGGRLRRQTDADGTQEKIDRRRKPGKEKIGRKPKAQVLAAAPAGSPMKIDRKEKPLGVKTEEDFGKRSLGEMPLPMQMQIQMGIVENQMPLPNDLPVHSGLSLGDGMLERSRPQANNTRPGPSSYWSVTEQNDFQRNVAHFGTDWVSIANHMGTKTHTMVRNQYLRLVEGGLVDDLQKLADEADHKRERGEDLGPPPTPTPAPKRRYESSSTNVPRTLAPTPEVADLLKSPGMLPVAPPQASPQFIPAARPISQAPLQAKPLVPSSGSIPIPESVAVLSMSQQQSPPIQPPRAQPPHQHQHTLSQQKPQHVGPRAGYFSDDLPRVDNRPPSQSSSMVQPPRTIQQQIQSHNRTQEPPQTSLFRTPVHQEREPQHRLEPQQDHDPHMRFQSSHSRRISQEQTHQRLFQAHVPGPGQMMSQMRSAPSAGSPENRPLSFHQSRYMSQAQPSGQLNVETVGQASIGMPGVLQHPSRSAIGTPPVKDEHRQFSMPQVSQSQVSQSQVSQSQVSQPQAPQPQAPPQLHTQSLGHPQLAQPSVQVPLAKPTPKPASEPRKSNLLSLLNDTEPEEPRRKKPVEQSIPSHTSTPQQQAPIAPPPPPVSQALPRPAPYNDVTTTQAQYGRTSYAPQAALSQAPSSRHIVDLTSEQPSGARPPHSREGWQQQRQHFHSGQSQSQQSSAVNSPHVTLAQPTFGGDTRIFGNHRSFLAQTNAPRHQPSPPPLSAFNNSPHMHSRTPSLSGAQPQQSRHGMSNATPVQHPQAPSSNHILQPNPYALVDPPRSSSQSSAPVGMRPSPHLHTSHVAQQREHQGRNEQAQIHNGALNYPNPHVLSENHPAHQHLRGPSTSEQYRGRDPRELHHDFDPRNSQRDMAMELSNRTENLLREQREQRESLMGRSTATPSGHQDHRYQPPQQERGYATQQRSHTPLSRAEHSQHAPLQHPPHSSLANDSHPIYGQRQLQEEPPQQFRNPFPPQNERERFPGRAREEQAQQHQHQPMRGDEYGGREREREMRERDPRYREEMMRGREAASRGGGPPPPTGPTQHAQDQRQGSSASNVDWANMARQQQERWQQR